MGDGESNSIKVMPIQRSTQFRKKIILDNHYVKIMIKFCEKAIFSK